MATRQNFFEPTLSCSFCLLCVCNCPAFCYRPLFGGKPSFQVSVTLLTLEWRYFEIRRSKQQHLVIGHWFDTMQSSDCSFDVYVAYHYVNYQARIIDVESKLFV